MNHPILIKLFTFLSTYIMATSVPAAVAISDDIRNIHGPLSSTGLPAFSWTAIISLSIGGYAIYYTKKRKNMILSRESCGTYHTNESLDSLRAAYLHGELNGQHVFDKLAPLIRERLGYAGHTAMTTAELLEDCSGKMKEESAIAAAYLLKLCDQVRFSGQAPDCDAIVATLDLAITAFGNIQENDK